MNALLQWIASLEEHWAAPVHQAIGTVAREMERTRDSWTTM